jgi:hypothetical protein
MNQYYIVIHQILIKILDHSVTYTTSEDTIRNVYAKAQANI